MSLTVVPITEEFSDKEAFDALNKEAFPPEDYIAIEDQIELAERDDFGLWAFYDGEEFIGFMLVMTYESLAYLLLIAVDPNKRSRGYGAAALEAFHEKYPSVQHVLDIERVDESAENAEQRKSRRSFYIRNGYQASGYFMDYGNGIYEILTKEEGFSVDAFKEMMLNSDEGFSPRFFQEE